jgi:type III secretion system needle length determinant
MKKQQISHISHDRQSQSLSLPSIAKLPLESDPVLKKRFESALKLAGSATPVSPLVTDKSSSVASYLLAEQPSMDAYPFSHGIKKKSTAQAEDKAHHRLSIATEERTDNCGQPYGNPPYTTIENKTATKTGNNDKLPPSTSKQKLPTAKAGRNNPLKAPLSANTLLANPITNQPIVSADLAKPIVNLPTGEQIVMTSPVNKRQPLSTKKISSVTDPNKITDPMEAIFPSEKKPHSANKEQDKGKRQENSIEPPSLPAVLSTATTTEKMLATVDNEKTSASLLNTLFNKLNAVINVEVNKNYQPPIIQLNLAQIGHLQIKIQQQQQHIMIEFVAQTMGQKILLDHQQDLINKLQRIHPEQHIQLVILNDQQSEERSKDRSQSLDDFEEEMT